MSEPASDPPAAKPRRKRKRRPAAGATAAQPRKRRKAGEAKPKPPPMPTGWRNPRTRLGGSGIVLIGGLVLVSLGPSELGAGLTLLGAMAFFYSIHRYGRLGPDQGGATL